jgi:uncharacterized protein (TIGR03435 family)
MKRVLVAGIFAALAVNTGLCQSNPDKLEFEAVSIKPSPPNARGGGYNLSPGRLNAKNQSLKDLVKFSFDLQDYQVTGGPGWLDTDRYEIFATFPGATTATERGRMMQSMLADRFALAVHQESREVQGYALEVNRGGPKFHAAAPGEHSMMLGRSPATGERTLTATSASMAGLAEMLATIMRRPVEDKTGLNGIFDFAVEWTPDETQVGLAVPGKEPHEAPADGPIGLSLSAALQKTLGLTLKTQKAPVEVIVIDHAEKASVN